MANKKGNKKQQDTISNRLVASIIALLVVSLSLIGIFNFGIVGYHLTNIISLLFGMIPVLYYVLIIIICVVTIIFYKKKLVIKWYHILGVVFVWIALQLILVIIENPELLGWNYVKGYFASIGPIYRREISAEGGITGALLYGLFTFLFDKLGTLFISIVLIIAGLMLAFNQLFDRIFEALDAKEKKVKVKKEKKVKPVVTTKPVIQPELELEPTPTEFKPVDMEEALNKQRKSIFIDSKDVTNSPTPEEKPSVVTEPIDPSQRYQEATYQLPSINLLDGVEGNKTSKSNLQSAQGRGQKLVSILQQFGVGTTLIDTHIGPSVTKFVLRLDTGVNVNRISSLQNNIMMELAVKDIRIEAPIPGQNAVGVEIPNVEMTPVRLKEILNAIPKEKQNKPLLFGLGKDLLGQAVFGELNRMPHLLIAGATGSGKSVGVNTMITTFLMRTKPSEVKLLLIDPKKVEFTVYQDVPHLIAPVISDPLEAARCLKVAVSLMEKRYEMFAKVGARNIASYNENISQGEEKLPYIVIIIDELADLMAVAGREVEGSIQRLTQLARAAGIHLVVATQRPSTDVITGIIKSNIPSRIAFAVSSSIDSRTIIDQGGAQDLLGYGDMLYLPIGEPNPVRVQGVYVSDREVSQVAEAVKQQGKPFYDDSFINLEGVNGNNGFVEPMSDPLYEEVKEYVITDQKASTSLLQRRFGLGYNRAARIIDALESEGIIGPQQGSKPRDVYVKPEFSEDEESF